MQNQTDNITKARSWVPSFAPKMSQLFRKARKLHYIEKYVVGSWLVWYVTFHQSLTFCVKRCDSYCSLFTLRYFSMIVFFYTPLIYVNKVNCFCVGSVVYKFNFFLPLKAVKISLESISSAMKLHLIVLSVFITSGMYIIWLFQELIKKSTRILIGILTGEIKWT